MESITASGASLYDAEIWSDEWCVENVPERRKRRHSEVDVVVCGVASIVMLRVIGVPAVRMIGSLEYCGVSDEALSGILS